MSVDAIALNPNRGRRRGLTPAGSTLSDGALAVLATVPAWWACRAADAGLSGACLDVEHAVATDAPVNVASLSRIEHRVDLLDATPEQVGDAYVTALDATVRSHTGRHYTPPRLPRHCGTRPRPPLTGTVTGSCSILPAERVHCCYRRCDRGSGPAMAPSPRLFWRR
ncbi:MAG: hypothetical protein ACRDRW_11910 [Pseudonocardiaceae bacterium]